MPKKIKQCTVNQLLSYRMLNLDKINKGTLDDLPFAIVIFLENPRLKDLPNNRDKTRLFKRFLYDLSPLIGEMIIEVEE